MQLMRRHSAQSARARLAMLLPLTAALIAASPSAAQTKSQAVTRVGEPAAAIASLVVVQQPRAIAFVSGTLAPAPGPGAPIAGDTQAQTVAIFTQMEQALKAQGMSLGDIVMMRVFLAGDPAQGGKMDFRGMMAGYRQFFGTATQPNKPARSTVQVAALVSPGALVEIEAQAVRP